MLNNHLYKGLKLAVAKGKLFGNEVKVKNQGQEMSVTYKTNALKKMNSANKAKVEETILDWGEVYQVCCPFCGDTRYRLDISYRWNTVNAKTNSNNLHLAKCYNEDCLKDFDNVLALKEMVSYSIGNRLSINKVKNIKPVEKEIHEIKPIDPPPSRDLALLPKDHPAIIFLENRRGYDAKKLSKYYDVSWIEHNFNPMLRHRVFVPFYDDTGTRIVAGQARYVDSNGSGNCASLFMCSNYNCNYMFRYHGDKKPKSCPSCGDTETTPNSVAKWYTLKGSKVGHHLYNLNNAKTWTFGVVVEGPADVWGLGNMYGPCMPGPGMAVCGHTISKPFQVSLLKDHFKKRNKPVFVVFDPEEHEKTERHIRELRDVYGEGLYVVKLPDGEDPGSLPHEDIWKLLKQSNNEHNLRIPEFN